MELWIRSQDKRILAKVDNIYLNANYDNEVICYEHNGEAADLGHYNSKERALEVLDEIQIHIEKQDTNELLVNSDGIINGQKYYGRVYEMPKE